MIKKIFSMSLVVSFVLATLLWFMLMNESAFYYMLYYWIVFVLVVLLVWIHKISSNYILYIALFITILAAVIGLTTLVDFGESVMRLGFVFWIIGSIRLLTE